MLGIFMVSVVFTRRSAIDATAIVASNCSAVHLEQKLYIVSKMQVTRKKTTLNAI
jgi:hypothetical protein